MKKDKIIEVKTTKEQLRNYLRTKVVSQFSDIIVDIIIDNLEKSPKGLEQLFVAFSGLLPITTYKEGDDVFVYMKHMATWNKDIQKMEQHNIINQGLIKGKIVNIDLQDTNPITVEFEGYDHHGIAKLFSETFDDVSLQPVPEDFMED